MHSSTAIQWNCGFSGNCVYPPWSHFFIKHAWQKKRGNSLLQWLVPYICVFQGSQIKINTWCVCISLRAAEISHRRNMFRSAAPRAQWTTIYSLQSSLQPYRLAPFNHLGWISHLSRPSLERTSFNLSDIRSSPMCSQDDSVPLSCRLLKPHSSSSKHSTEEENRIQVFVCFPVAVTKCLAWASCAREGFLGSQLGDTGHGGQEAVEVSFKKPCSSLGV